MTARIFKSVSFGYTRPMIRFTELVYLAAPFALPEERAFNQRLANLVRSYNYPLFMPEEIRPELAEHGCLRDWKPRADMELPGTPEADLDLLMTEACLDAINRANLMIAVYYGEEFDPLTAFEVGYALGRRTHVVAVQNTLLPELVRSGTIERLASPQFCSRIVIAPHDDERFPDRLIPILNRFFVPHKL